MATVDRHTEIGRNKGFVCDAIRDVGAIHRRLVSGFVVDRKLEGDSRTVAFANGMVVREVIVAVDDKTCRHAWSARGTPFAHHNASIQVFSEGDKKCRLVWIADVMSNEVVDTVGEMDVTCFSRDEADAGKQPSWSLTVGKVIACRKALEIMRNVA